MYSVEEKSVEKWWEDAKRLEKWNKDEFYYEMPYILKLKYHNSPKISEDGITLPIYQGWFTLQVRYIDGLLVADYGHWQFNEQPIPNKWGCFDAENLRDWINEVDKEIREKVPESHIKKFPFVPI